MSASAPARVFCVTRIGDLVLATVTFDALKARYGSIHLVTSTLADGLLDGDDRVSRLDVMAHPGALRGRAAIMRHLMEARRSSAVVVNLEVFTPRWKFIRRTARILGLEAYHLDLDAYRMAERARAPRHAAEFYAEVLGLSPAPPPTLHVADRADEEARSILGEASGPVVAVHPGSSGGWTAKRAPTDLLAEAVRLVADETACRVLFVGGRGESALCRTVLEASGIGGRGTSLAGSVALRLLPALLRRVDVFLGGDSGPLKIAEAVGTATVSLWTVTDPARLGPRGAGHATLRVDGHAPTARQVADHVLRLLPRGDA